MQMPQKDNIDFDPPPGCPPYSKDACRCKIVNFAVREAVERASRSIVLAAEEKRRIDGEVPDEWWRERCSAAGGPIMTLHEYYAGMGGRSIMGAGVGGFALGAACPSGGIAAVTTCTYDYMWFALLINRYLNSVLEAAESPAGCQAMECFEAELPDRFSCWQLNFGKNDSAEMSKMCFYNPHIDRQNAKVSSVGTSFGDYEGGGVWIAHPEGKTLVEFDGEVVGIRPGLVPGHVKHQKVKWSAFWAARMVHAIPPFRKNRIGMVAFSSQTALRVTPEEKKFLDCLEFKMPHHGDARFMPAVPALVRLKEEDAANLSEEDKARREREQAEYEKASGRHQTECEQLSRLLAASVSQMNRKRIICSVEKQADGANVIVVRPRRAPEIDDWSTEDYFSAIIAEGNALAEQMDKLEKLSTKAGINDVGAVWRDLQKTFKEMITDDRLFENICNSDESDGEGRVATTADTRSELDATVGEQKSDTREDENCEDEVEVGEVLEAGKDGLPEQKAMEALPPRNTTFEALPTPSACEEASSLPTPSSSSKHVAQLAAIASNEAAAQPAPCASNEAAEHCVPSASGEPVAQATASCEPAAQPSSSSEPAAQPSSSSEPAAHPSASSTSAAQSTSASKPAVQPSASSTSAAHPSASSTSTVQTERVQVSGGVYDKTHRIVLGQTRGCVVPNASGGLVVFDELENVHLFWRSAAPSLTRTRRKQYESRRWNEKLRYGTDPSTYDKTHAAAAAEPAAKAVAALSEPAKSEPARTQPARSQPAQSSEPARSQPAQRSEPARSQPARSSEPAKSQPAQSSEPAKSQPAQSSSKPAVPPTNSPAAIARPVVGIRAALAPAPVGQSAYRPISAAHTRVGLRPVKVVDLEDDDIEVVKSTLGMPRVPVWSQAAGLQRPLGPNVRMFPTGHPFPPLFPHACATAHFPSFIPAGCVGMSTQAVSLGASKRMEEAEDSNAPKKARVDPLAENGCKQLPRISTSQFMPGEVVHLEEREGGALVVD